MRIVKERTRLLITEFTSNERSEIENYVAAMDNVFLYYDKDKDLIGLPTGVEKSFREKFKDAEFIDHSNEFWDFAKIQPVHHDAKPRNQLQIDFINFVLDNAKDHKKLAGILSTGTGKGNPLSTPIPTPSGWTTMGELKIGDRVFNAHGQPVRVTGLYPQGVEDVYEITFSDGRKARCDENHLWETVRAWPSNRAVLRLGDMVDTYKVYRPYKSIDGSNRDPFDYRYKIPLLDAPVQYDPQPVPVHPYVIGALIGNGCLCDKPLSISSGDDFVPNKISSLCGFSGVYKNPANYTYTFYNGSTFKNKQSHVKTDEFLKDLPELLNKRSDEKCIPPCYLYNSTGVRLELLQGLMDTAGSIVKGDGTRFNISYSSTSKKLLEQIQELIRGLGFIATIGAPDRRSEHYRNGYCASVYIRVPHKFKPLIFTHPIKHALAEQAALIKDVRQPFTHLTIKNIEKVGQEECQCITVDDPEHLYLCDQFIVTHNTFMACYSAINAGLRTLIIAPTSGIKQQWADTLTGMFNVPEERIIVVNSPKDFINVHKDFVIVSHASLAALNKNYDLEKIMMNNKFGTKVIDEVQMNFKNIIMIDSCSNIANNWYLTGTFGRSGDEENKIYQEMFGDLNIFREKDKDPTLFNRKPGNIYGMKPYIYVNMIWGHSGLSQEEIKSVTNSMRYSEREGKWVRYGISVPNYMKLVIPEDGHMTPYLKMILDTVEEAEKKVKYGSTLVLGSTIAAAEVVAEHLRKRLPKKDIRTYHSRHTQEENERNKKECDILVSTVSSAGTGFDMKGLAKLIVYAPFKSWILADQISGRNRRRLDGKPCYMWDIVDADIPQLRAWARSRADVLRRKAKVFKVIDPY